MLTNQEKSMDKIVDLCKSRGFVYAGSEIYGGLANTWDYGPLGVELKNNIKRAWWQKFVQECPYNVGLDSAILMNPQTWVASGHLGGFSDPLMDCKACKTRHRADNLIEDFDGTNPAGWSNEEMMNYIREKQIPCPNCGKSDFTDIRQFNLMFKTFQGVTEDSKSELYLRPETAQGIFVDFANIQRTTRKKVPFGVGQIGKSFRNEITPGNFIFRVREFEQMELEFFCKPDTDLEWFQYWRGYCKDFLLNLGIKEENLRLRDHDAEELCFYSKATTDFEYRFAFGWGELWGFVTCTRLPFHRQWSPSQKWRVVCCSVTMSLRMKRRYSPIFQLARRFFPLQRQLLFWALRFPLPAASCISFSAIWAAMGCQRLYLPPLHSRLARSCGRCFKSCCRLHWGHSSQI